MAKVAERAVKFRLNHSCHIPACYGSAGDVVETREEIAKFLAAHGGGEIIKETELPKQESK